MTLQDGITDLLLLAAAAAAFWLGWLTRTDIREAREARYDQSRPILMYDGKGIFLAVEEVPGQVGFFFADLSNAHISVQLRNIGTGPALNVRGVLFGPAPSIPSEDQTPLSFRLPAPITPGDMYSMGTKQGAFGIQGTTTIVRGHTLYSPPRPSPSDFAAGIAPCIVARLTVTYHDIFGRKHASIFDYNTQEEWRTVAEGFFPDIKKDIEDLSWERARLSAQPFGPSPISPIPPQMRA